MGETIEQAKKEVDEKVDNMYKAVYKPGERLVQDMGKDIEKRTHKAGRFFSDAAEKTVGAAGEAGKALAKNVEKSGQGLLQDVGASIQSGDWSRTLLDASLKLNPITAAYNLLSPEDRDKVRGESTTQRYMSALDAKAQAEAADALQAQRAELSAENLRAQKEQMKALADTMALIGGGGSGGLRRQSLGGSTYTLFGGPPVQSNSLLTQIRG